MFSDVDQDDKDEEVHLKTECEWKSVGNNTWERICKCKKYSAKIVIHAKSACEYLKKREWRDHGWVYVWKMHCHCSQRSKNRR